MQTQILNEFSKNYNKSTPYLKDRISYAAKIANNYEWVRNKIDYYSRHHLSYNERKKQLEINYNLYNGQYEEKDYAYLFKQFGFETELKNATFKHFDIMSEPLREIVGKRREDLLNQWWWLLTLMLLLGRERKRQSYCSNIFI